MLLDEEVAGDSEFEFSHHHDAALSPSQVGSVLLVILNPASWTFRHFHGDRAECQALFLQHGIGPKDGFHAAAQLKPFLRPWRATWCCSLGAVLNSSSSWDQVRIQILRLVDQN